MNLIKWMLLYFGKEIDGKTSYLHNVCRKQALKIKCQTARIAELEALYAGTVESKNHKILQEKYARCRANLWLQGNEDDE